MSRKLKCACEITAAEALADRIDAEKPPRSVLIVDTGIGWTVTMYGPQCFGLPTEHVTLQSALEAVEGAMVNVRRQKDDDKRGVVVTDPAEIARLMTGK